MKRHVALTAVLVAIAAGGCYAHDENALREVCGEASQSNPCALPIEFLYSHRSDTYGALVSLDGVLVIGTAPEPPENPATKALLFSSHERARSCNSATAIEVFLPADTEIGVQQEGIGYPVTLIGRIRPSSAGHWLALEVVTKPSLHYTGTDYIGTCLAKPPPVLEPSG